MTYWLLHVNHTIKSDLTKNQLKDRLKENLKTGSHLKSMISGKTYFTGSIYKDTFYLKPILDHRNSFAPIVKGKFVETPDGCLVNIRLRIHPVVFIFLFIWVAINFISGWANLYLTIGIAAALYFFVFVFFNLAAEQIENEMDIIFKRKNK